MHDDVNAPLWPPVDPDPPTRTVARTPRPRRGLWRLGYAAVAVLLVAALAVPAALVAGSWPRTVPGTALPAPATATPAGTTEPTPTSTTPAVRRVFLLADHPLLADGVRLPDAECALPRFRRDTPSLNAYYTALVDCLNRTWQPVLASGLLPYADPDVNVEEHPGDTGCGNPDEDDRLSDFTAMYCPADQTLYLPVNRMKDVDRGVASTHIAVVAHEYAHHVQELSGLLWASEKEIDKAGDGTPRGNELTRRSELQANCFAGLFIAAAAGRGSVTRALADQAVAEFRNGALPETHGSRANQAAWARKGYQERTTAACNTWSAPAASVS